MIWLGLFAIIGSVIGASDLTFGFFDGQLEEVFSKSKFKLLLAVM